MKLRCYLASLLKIHRPECEHCNIDEAPGREIRKRLEELNLRKQPQNLNTGSREEKVRAIDSQDHEVLSSPPAASVPQKKIV